jgi:quercetin dioxygenase-like cupin family protein
MKRAASWAITAIAAVGTVPLSIVAMAGMTTSDQQDVSVLRAGAGPWSEGSADNFTGKVRVEDRFQRDAPARVGGATVTFEPGARTAWHTHPLGQTLIVVRGRGLVQVWGRPAISMGPGDIVWIPPGVKHWHGAVAAESMSHVAMAELQGSSSVTWLEPVSDTQYADASRAQPR